MSAAIKRVVPSCLAAAAVAVLGALMPTPASATPFAVTGLSNIYGSGHAVAPDSGDGGFGGGGTLPFEFSFAAGAGQVLRFSGVAGAVDCVVRAPTIDADGAPCVGANTNLLPFGGISGIASDGRQMYLVGLFTDGTEPADPAPASLGYGAGDYASASYAPLLRQVFFVGDGLTGTGAGAVQDFHVPAGATRLYLGFADAFAFGDDVPGGRTVGWYGDNVGTLAGEFTIGQVPAPGTLASLAIGLGLLGSIRRRTRA